MQQINFETGSIKKVLFQLAIPSMLAQIVNMLYNLVDRIYVGSIEDYGTQALAGLGVCFPITLIISSFSALLGLGGAALSSIKLGEKKDQEANRIFNHAFITLFLISIILMIVTAIFAKDILLLFGCPNDSLVYAVSYLRIYSFGSVFTLISLGLNPFINAQGFSYSAMITVFIGAFANIILDPIFIFGFKLGIEGAAIATIVSQMISFLFVSSFFLRKKSFYRYKITDFRPTKLLLSMMLLGLSPFIMQITESAIQIVFSVQLKVYTNGNSSYTAAITILLSALQFISYPLNGFSNGVQPLISYNYGARNTKRVKKAIYIVAICSFVYTAAFYLLSMIFPTIYANLFSASKEVTIVIQKYGRLFLMGTIMFFAQMSLQNVFVALGQAKVSIFLACLRKIILLIPLCFILPIYLDAKGVFLSEGISDVIAGIITFTTFVIYTKQLLKKMDKKDNIEEVKCYI